MQAGNTSLFEGNEVIGNHAPYAAGGDILIVVPHDVADPLDLRPFDVRRNIAEVEVRIGPLAVLFEIARRFPK